MKKYWKLNLEDTLTVLQKSSSEIPRMKRLKNTVSTVLYSYKSNSYICIKWLRILFSEVLYCLLAIYNVNWIYISKRSTNMSIIQTCWFTWKHFESGFVLILASFCIGFSWELSQTLSKLVFFNTQVQTIVASYWCLHIS